MAYYWEKGLFSKYREASEFDVSIKKIVLLRLKYDPEFRLALYKKVQLFLSDPKVMSKCVKEGYGFCMVFQYFGKHTLIEAGKEEYPNNKNVFMPPWKNSWNECIGEWFSFYDNDRKDWHPIKTYLPELYKAGLKRPDRSATGTYWFYGKEAWTKRMEVLSNAIEATKVKKPGFVWKAIKLINSVYPL